MLSAAWLSDSQWWNDGESQLVWEITGPARGGALPREGRGDAGMWALGDGTRGCGHSRTGRGDSGTGRGDGMRGRHAAGMGRGDTVGGWTPGQHTGMGRRAPWLSALAHPTRGGPSDLVHPVLPTPEGGEALGPSWTRRGRASRGAGHSVEHRDGRTPRWSRRAARDPARPQSGPGAQQGLTTQKRAVFPTALRLLLLELRLPCTLAKLAFVRLLHVLPTC